MRWVSHGTFSFDAVPHTVLRVHPRTDQSDRTRERGTAAGAVDAVPSLLDAVPSASQTHHSQDLRPRATCPPHTIHEVGHASAPPPPRPVSTYAPAATGPWAIRPAPPSAFAVHLGGTFLPQRIHPCKYAPRPVHGSADHGKQAMRGGAKHGIRTSSAQAPIGQWVRHASSAAHHRVAVPICAALVCRA
ncbi:hypothetical protein B0H10DRAFT_1991325 [Mycena sp. CBHHK59/15]|nr:hypothetical protein B0H10DRAFT_1991325 [Mycena sp. CBHHK59/15]